MDNKGCIWSDNITTPKWNRIKPWPYLWYILHMSRRICKKSKHPNIVQVSPLSLIINMYHTNNLAFYYMKCLHQQRFIECRVMHLNSEMKWPIHNVSCTSYTMHRTKYVKGIHQWPMNSPHKGTVVWKALPCRAIVKSCSAHIVCTCFMMRTINYSVYSEDIIVYLAIDSIAWYHISITTAIYMISTCIGLIFF